MCGLSLVTLHGGLIVVCRCNSLLGCIHAQLHTPDYMPAAQSAVVELLSLHLDGVVHRHLAVPLNNFASVDQCIQLQQCRHCHVTQVRHCFRVSIEFDPFY